jgi:hypothetical protein
MMKDIGKVVLEKIRFDWDNEKNPEIILFRKMKWDDPLQLVSKYDQTFLRKVYLKYYYKLDKRNRNFWKLILEISDEEINTKANKRFGDACRIRDF